MFTPNQLLMNGAYPEFQVHGGKKCTYLQACWKWMKSKWTHILKHPNLGISIAIYSGTLGAIGGGTLMLQFLSGSSNRNIGCYLSPNLMTSELGVEVVRDVH